MKNHLSGRKAQGHMVLILPDELPEKTKGGLAIPRTAKEKPKSGTIIDCGPDCEIAEKGKRILFSRGSSSIEIIDGKEYCWVSETKILYVYL